MLELAAAIEMARKATRSAIEEEPAGFLPVQRSPRLRPAVAAGLRWLAGAIDVPSAGHGARVQKSSSI